MGKKKKDKKDNKHKKKDKKSKQKSKKMPIIKNNVKVNVNCNCSPDVNVKCECNCHSGKSSSSSKETEPKALQGIESKDSKDTPSKSKEPSKGMGFKNIIGNIGKVATKAAGIGIIVADVAKNIGTGILDLTTKTSQASVEIIRISEETGLSTTKLQELKYAASQTGVEFSNIQTAAVSMNDTIALAREGNNAQAEAFQALGVAIQDTQGNLLSSDEIFNQVVTKLGNMADETERNALASQIFGSTATELTPMLEAGGEGLQAYKDRAHELGLVMSEEVLESNAKFSESLGNMKDVMGKIKGEFEQVGAAVMDKIGSALIPILEKLFNWISENMPMIQEITGTVFGFIGESIDFFIQLIKDIINWFKEWTANNEETINSIKDKFSSLFEAVKSTFEAIVDRIEEALEFIGELWNKYGDEIMAVLEAAWDIIVTIIETAITIITDIFNIFAALFKGDWEGLWNGIKELFSNIWEGINNILGKYIEALKLAVSTGLGFIKDIFSNIWNGIKDVVTGVWDGIVSGIKGSINTILKAINSMINGMNKLKFDIPDWIPIIGGKTWGLNIPKIPLLAQGGYIAGSGLAVVGERGPELLQLPRGARVYSNNDTKEILSRGGINQNITINSPIPLSPSLIKRKTLEASRQLAMEWGV